MENLYHIAKISDGKGLGCVALNDIKKGTLILREKPQCFVNQTHFSDGGISTIQGLMKSYNKMNKDDQEEYLKLYNKFKDLDFLTYEEKKHLEKQKKYLQEVFCMNPVQINIFQEIYGIYFTNVYEMGLCLKTSRFNHSCVSNSQVFWNEKYETRDIRAVSKIKVGEEITVRYGSPNLEMKKFKIRQEHLSMGWKFNCRCPLCEEEAKNCHDEKYEKFESLKQEACLDNRITHCSLG